MIKLSNGVEISEDTVINALRKAGINVEPVHFFKAGDVAKNVDGHWRFIIGYNGILHSVDAFGGICGSGQQHFEDKLYEYVGRQNELAANS